MKYNLSSPSEVKRADEYFNTLKDKKALVEIKKVSPRRSLQQNNYLYLIIAAFSAHFGMTKDEGKDIYKALNQDIFFRKVKVGDKEFLTIRSSSDLTKEEMAKSIDRFREFSAEQDYPLPLATDQEYLMRLENLIEQQERYL